MDTIKITPHELKLINKLKKEYEDKLKQLIEEIYEEIEKESNKNT